MRIVLLILLFHIVLVHFLVRAILLEFLSGYRYYRAMGRKEVGYFKWERWQILYVYFLPVIPLVVGEIFGFWVTFCFSIFVAILRSIEHIDRSIIK